MIPKGNDIILASFGLLYCGFISYWGADRVVVVHIHWLYHVFVRFSQYLCRLLQNKLLI